MEEKTTKKAAEFSAQQPKQLSYEEVSRKLNEALMERGKLIQHLQEADKYIETLQTQNLFTYMSFLFKVMEHPEMYSPDFVTNCVTYTEDLMGRLHSIISPEPNQPEADGSAEKTE